MKCPKCDADVSLLKRDIATGLCSECLEAVRLERREQEQREDEEEKREFKRKRDEFDARKLKEQQRRVNDSLCAKVAKCPKCGEQELIKSLRVIDSDEGINDLRILIEETPIALWFKDSVMHPLKASACGNCGYTELYVESPAALWQSFTKSVENAPS